MHILSIFSSAGLYGGDMYVYLEFTSLLHIEMVRGQFRHVPDEESGQDIRNVTTCDTQVLVWWNI